MTYSKRQMREIEVILNQLPEKEFIEIEGYPLRYPVKYVPFAYSNILWVLDFYLYAAEQVSEQEEDEVDWLWNNVLKDLDNTQLIAEIMYGIGLLLGEHLQISLEEIEEVIEE